MPSCESHDLSRNPANCIEETLLRRLAHHRTGQGEIDIAFELPELARLRQILVSAAQAQGRLVRPRR